MKRGFKYLNEETTTRGEDMMAVQHREFAKRSGKRWISILLIAAMLLALLPPAGVMANQGISDPVILNLYQGSEDEAKENDHLIPRSTTSPITLEVSVTGLDVTQLDRIYYQVANVTTNREFPPARENRGRLDSTGTMVTFDNVELTPGLNRIQVILELEGSSQVVKSQYGWVYFTPVTAIHNLTAGGQPFTRDVILPKGGITDPWSSMITISGQVLNASEITIYHHETGTTYVSGIYGNLFSVSADREDGFTNSIFTLLPGDNNFTFIASNAGYTTQEQRSLIYDDGDAFVFDITVDGQKLIEKPTIKKEPVDNQLPTLPLKGKFKVDYDEDGQLEYNELVIRTGSNLGYEIARISIDPSNLVKDEKLSVEGKYVVFDLPEDITIDPNQLPADEQYHTVIFEFLPSGSEDRVLDHMGFYFQNTNLPYVQYVARKVSEDDDQGLRLSENNYNEISEQPVTFFIYTDPTAAGVHIYFDDPHRQEEPYYYDETKMTKLQDGLYEVTIDGIPGGEHEMFVYPLYEESGTVKEHRAGLRRYFFRFNTTPYVIVDMPDNHQIHGNKDLTPIHINGRIVNVTEQTASLKVYLNGRGISDKLTVNWETKKFTLELSDQPGDLNGLLEGRNTLSFQIFSNTQSQPISTKTLVLFRYRLESPALNNVRIKEEDPANPKFVRNPNNIDPDAYYTEEETVEILGDLANVKIITISVTYEDDKLPNPEPQSYDLTDLKFPDNPLFQVLTKNTFETVPIRLAPNGNTRILIEVTNDTGIKRTQSFVILRQAREFSIVYPRTFVNKDGNLQANINSNYSVIEIKAEYADRIIYDKNQVAEYDEKNKVYRFEVRDLKTGANKVTFKVVTGESEREGTLILYNENQPVVGAQYKTKIKNRIRAFNNQLEVQFPRTASLMRTGGDSDKNQYLTRERWLLFGIANEMNGEVDPFRDPAGSTILYPFISRDEYNSYQPVSPLYWIDAGTISRDTDDLEDALTGSGQLPHLGRDYYMTRLPQDIVVPTERVTITIQYDPYITREAWRHLAVFQYHPVEDETGINRARWTKLGGIVDTKKNTITVEVDSFGYFQVMYMTHSFNDIIDHRWAKQELEMMYAKGYMNPKNPPSNFSPYDTITRGEFITLLVKMFDIPLDYKGQLTFDDVRPNDPNSSYGMYDYRYIETAARKGYVRGTGGRLFNPNLPIRRQDAAAMIAAIGNMKLESDRTKIEKALDFTDLSAIDPYQLPSVHAVTKAGYMTGIPNNVLPGEKQTYYFNPNGYLTRDEAAVIATRILHDKKRTFK